MKEIIKDWNFEIPIASILCISLSMSEKDTYSLGTISFCELNKNFKYEKDSFIWILAFQSKKSLIYTYKRQGLREDKNYWRKKVMPFMNTFKRKEETLGTSQVEWQFQLTHLKYKDDGAQ